MSLTIFRAFRLLRGLRLFRKWKTFHKMMIKIAQTLKDILTFFVLLLIIVFVFALLGVELFAGKVRVDKDN
jgi:voltage-dependent calcium channel L type alpha-1D